MHQVSSRLSKLALSVMLAFALVPTASVAAMADPQISDPASDPVIQSPSIDQGVSEEAPASTESWQGEGSEPAEADETAQPDSEAEASAAALGPDRQPVGFVYFDESSPSANGWRARLPPTAARCWWICPPVRASPTRSWWPSRKPKRFPCPMSRPAACPCTH